MIILSYKNIPSFVTKAKIKYSKRKFLKIKFDESRGFFYLITT